MSEGTSEGIEGVADKIETTNNNVDIDAIFAEAMHEKKTEGQVENHPDMPQKHFRWLVIGPSGCGKTTEILKYVIDGRLLYDRIYVYARDLGEQKYSFLMKLFGQIADQLGMSVDDLMVVGDQPEDIISVEELDRSRQNLIIFDDFIADSRTNNTIIREHFIRGRKMNCSYIYLSQAWAATNKDIRKNCNYVTMFGGLTERDVDEIRRGTNPGVNIKEWRDLYRKATAQKHNSMRIKLG